MGNRRPNASCCVLVLVAAAAAPACANGDTTDTPSDEDAGAYANPGSGSLAASGTDIGNSGSVSAGSVSAGSTSSGGGSGSAEGGGAAPNTGLSVLYQVESASSSSPYLGCELSIVNAGAGSPAISNLTARYYFTDEVHLAEQMTINWSHVTTSGANADMTVTSSFAPVVPAVKGADTYVQFGFSSGHALLGPGESIMFAWQMQAPDPAKDLYTQSNDYSFDDSKKTLTAWSHVVLLQNGSVVWGVPPL